MRDMVHNGRGKGAPARVRGNVQKQMKYMGQHRRIPALTLPHPKRSSVSTEDYYTTEAIYSPRTGTHTSHYTSDFTLYNPPPAQARTAYTTAKQVSTTDHLVIFDKTSQRHT